MSVLPAGRARAVDQGHRTLLLTAVPVLLVLGARIWSGTDPASVQAASTLIAVVSFVHGMTLFVLLGGDRATMAGCFQAASAAIVGLSGLLVIPDPYFMEGSHPDALLQTALLGGTLAQIGIGALGLQAEARRPDARAPLPAVVLPDAAVRRAQVSGLILLAVSVALGERLGAFLDGFGFTAILLVCTATVLGRRGLGSPGAVLLVLGALASYPLLVISGTGRLRAIALGLAVAYIVLLRHGRRWMKTLGVLAAPLLLAVLGIWRREYEEATTGEAGNETGLSSMFVAIGNFGDLIGASRRGLEPTLGSSLLSPLRSALPEDLVPAWVPEAIGYELAALTEPDLYGTGFSTVASVYGDLWWNFGPMGLVLGVPVLAALLERIDAWALASYRRAAEGGPRLLLLVVLSALLGGVGDVVWAGFHTWIVRMYARVAAALVLGLLSLYLPAAIRAPSRARPARVTFGGTAPAARGAVPTVAGTSPTARRTAPSRPATLVEG